MQEGYAKKALSGLSDCSLCPHECHVDRTKGEVGVCRSTTDVRVGRFALHFWEEPPISGSAGSGTIFFSGCNLGCAYCQNHAISRGGSGRVASIEDIAEMCLDLQDQGAMNINLVTPTHYSPQIRCAIEVARDSGLFLPIIWNTSGYESSRTIEENAGYADIYLTDFKYFDDDLAKSFSGIHDYRVRATEAIDKMILDVGLPSFDTFKDEERLVGGVVIRHMVIPGHVDDSKRVLSYLWNRYADKALFSIMNQYTPVLASAADCGEMFAKNVLEQFPELGRSVYLEEYEQVLDYADEIGLVDYFWQDGETYVESFIPDFDKRI